MQLPTSKLEKNKREAVRFTIIGTTGVGIQYAIYGAFLILFVRLWADADGNITDGLTRIAFTLGFVFEMCTNYLLTAWYTFSSSPSWKNLAGFAISRACNFVVQFVTLELLLLASLNAKQAGFIAIVIAGIVNFFVVRIFFKEKK